MRAAHRQCVAEQEVMSFILWRSAFEKLAWFCCVTLKASLSKRVSVKKIQTHSKCLRHWQKTGKAGPPLWHLNNVSHCLDPFSHDFHVLPPQKNEPRLKMLHCRYFARRANSCISLDGAITDCSKNTAKVYLAFWNWALCDVTKIRYSLLPSSLRPLAEESIGASTTLNRTPVPSCRPGSSIYFYSCT